MATTPVREYFASLTRGDSAAMRAIYAEDADIWVQGLLEGATRDELIAYFEHMWAAVPDWSCELLEYHEDGDHAVARWRMTGTFAGPGRLNGFEPNGARLDVQGADIITIRDGRIVRNHAFTDAMTVARQIGAVPPADSPADRRLTRAINARTRLRQRLSGRGPDQIAEGVWRVQGAEPGKCNVYLLRDGDGVCMFDAGARVMAPALAAAAARLGGLTRIVLGHGHTDHRGAAPSFDVPVLCHPDDVADAEGSGGWRYWDEDLRFLPAPQRPVHRFLHRRIWDGGPVRIAGTVAEGDEVAGFEVVHLPGHAPGLIALWRERDRLALASDAFYTLDMWGRTCPPQLPLDGYNLDTDGARASLRRLAALEPSAAWPGHAAPVTGDVRDQLEEAAG